MDLGIGRQGDLPGGRDGGADFAVGVLVEDDIERAGAQRAAGRIAELMRDDAEDSDVSYPEAEKKVG